MWKYFVLVAISAFGFLQVCSWFCRSVCDPCTCCVGFIQNSYHIYTQDLHYPGEWCEMRFTDAETKVKSVYIYTLQEKLHAEQHTVILGSISINTVKILFRSLPLGYEYCCIHTEIFLHLAFQTEAGFPYPQYLLLLLQYVLCQTWKNAVWLFPTSLLWLPFSLYSSNTADPRKES